MAAVASPGVTAPFRLGGRRRDREQGAEVS